MRTSVKKFDRRLLKTLIKKNGITQGQFADIIGVSRITVDFWIEGRTKPSAFNLECIADCFYLPKKVFTGELPYTPECCGKLCVGGIDNA